MPSHVFAVKHEDSTKKKTLLTYHIRGQNAFAGFPQHFHIVNASTKSKKQSTIINKWISAQSVKRTIPNLKKESQFNHYWMRWYGNKNNCLTQKI